MIGSCLRARLRFSRRWVPISGKENALPTSGSIAATVAQSPRAAMETPYPDAAPSPQPTDRRPAFPRLFTEIRFRATPKASYGIMLRYTVHKENPICPLHPASHLPPTSARRLQPVVVGGDILAYSYVRELHRAYGVERTIVLATQDIKMLSSSRFTDYRLEPNIHEPEGLYDALERVAAEVRAEDPDRVLLVLGCDDFHARMLSSGKPRLEAAGYTVPYIDFDLLDDITQKRRFYELCDELDIPYPRTWYF